MQTSFLRIAAYLAAVIFVFPANAAPVDREVRALAGTGIYMRGRLLPFIPVARRSFDDRAGGTQPTLERRSQHGSTDDIVYKRESAHADMDPVLEPRLLDCPPSENLVEQGPRPDSGGNLAGDLACIPRRSAPTFGPTPRFL